MTTGIINCKFAWKENCFMIEKPQNAWFDMSTTELIRMYDSQHSKPEGTIRVRKILVSFKIRLGNF